MNFSISTQTFLFLKRLKVNNNREWFAANKADYEMAKENVVHYLNDFIEKLAETESEILKIEGKKALFRIYRDIRFSLDKTPYKNHFGASIGMGKYNRVSGYYLHIEPKNSFLAGGVYLPEKENLKKIRNKISVESKKFLKIINDSKFKENFTALSTEDQLKRIPQGFDKEDPMAEYLKLKSFVVRFPLSDEDFTTNKNAKQLYLICDSIKPLNEFIEEAIST